MSSLYLIPFAPELASRYVQEALPDLDPIDLPFAIWLAGFIDGEGCFSISKEVRQNGMTVHGLSLIIVNTNRQIIEEIHRAFPDGYFTVKEAKGNRRACFRFTICGDAAKRVIALVRPYLRVKRLQAEIALDFETRSNGPGGLLLPESCRERREESYLHMHKLNTRGMGAVGARRGRPRKRPDHGKA